MMQPGYRDYRDNRPSQPEQPQGPADHNCQAQGCPLLGTTSLSFGEGSRFYCRYHAQANSDDWGRISDNLRRNQSLVTHTQHMEARTFNGYYREHQKAARVREHDYSFKLAPKLPKETHEEYVRRLQAIVRKAVFSFQ